MSKRNIIFICVAVVVVIAIALIVYFVVANQSNKTSDDTKIVLEKYENYELAKTIEITDKKTINELNTICNNVSLEQDENTENLAIRNDVKLDLKNGKVFFIQLDLPEYCYMEDSSSNTKLVIKTPSGLLDSVNNILNENQ